MLCLALSVAGLAQAAATPATPLSASLPRRAYTVFAAASLRDLVTEAAEKLRKDSARAIRLQFESSAVLARQIRAGAACDVFLSADARWVVESGPLDRFDWLGNRLVLAVPAGEAPGASHPGRIGTLVLAQPESPLGRYAAEAVRRLRITPKRTVYASNARDVIAKLSAGAGEAGIAYATDARADRRVRVLRELPADAHAPVVYVACLMTRDARPLMDELRRPWVAALARSKGFSAPP